MLTKSYLWGENADEFIKNFISIIALRYGSKKLLKEISRENSVLYKKDVYITLKNIVQAVVFTGNTKVEKLEALKQAKNIYNNPIFSLGFNNPNFIVKKLPDFQEIIDDMKFYKSCFEMNAYNIINTIVNLVIAQITDMDLNKLFIEGVGHLERFIQHSLATNPNWNIKTLTSDNPKLVIPIGAAGCGKSTFYKELGNVVNISCDNIRYLLFSSYGPSFAAWESSLSWWVVNMLTDYYLNRGYSVFFNGVNTDLEYRSPMSMEAPDSLYEGLKYNIKLVYFEPPVKLNDAELAELKAINLWTTPIEKLDMTKISTNVKKIIEMIKTNVDRTFQRTKEIREGKKDQDPFDILYAVPAPIVKLFVEQNFDRPTSANVVVIPRKEIPDPLEREKFYKEYAALVLK